MVGNEYRTHLKVKRDTRRVEIGYIGQHLETVSHS